ncbi:allantoate amidohydrolase [Halotalea alkalilenta]|uniref:allantoate amidohydrolase n=1 Tax=Halotalea alkalilenta TaxID=376489 RepID=UPI000693DA3E|nr:allantoate amidohydrolase [Halotalea alkalilenta]
MMLDAQAVLAGCDRLATLSSLEDGIERVYLSSEHARANQLVAAWAESAGMRTWQDAAGNLCGRLEGRRPGMPALLLASHLDTVPHAGRYDGILGVLVAIAVIGRLKRDKRQLPFAVELAGFADEEGTRFGATLLGSRALAGSWDPDWWQLTDAKGVSLEQAFSTFGLDPARIGEAARDPASLIGYLEVHIEQGPVLEARDRALGVVTAIAGARRFAVTLEGQAGHAGTNPFALRHDALCAASEAVLSIETLSRAAGCVGTVGQLTVSPGAVNVIPGRVDFSIDLRGEEDATRDRVWHAIDETLARIGEARGVSVSRRETHRASAQLCSPRLQEIVAEGIRATGDMAPLHLFSGAGHDAMAVGALTEVGMLFVRCAGGISHHPDEAVSQQDVALAIDALEASVLALARRYD